MDSDGEVPASDEAADSGSCVVVDASGLLNVGVNPVCGVSSEAEIEGNGDVVPSDSVQAFVPSGWDKHDRSTP